MFRSVLRRIIVTVKSPLIQIGGVVGVPVYFGLELVVRALNVGRARPLTQREVAVIADACAHTGLEEVCRPLTRIPLDAVRIAPARLLPIQHRAITLGRTMFVKGGIDVDRRHDRELLVHELVHIAQREECGRVGMARQYSAHFCDGFSYREHVMEIEARAIAAAVDEAFGDTAPEPI